MSGTKLRAFIITIQAGTSPPEIFYILAKNPDQARFRACQLSNSARSVVRKTVAA
jgi:hypothetical protein